MTTATEDKAQAPVNLNANSVMIAVRLTKPGNSKKVKSEMIEVDADPDSIRVSKELLDSPEMKQITTYDGLIRRWLAVRSMPNHGLLKGGVFRIPLSLVEEVDEQLEQFAGTRNAMIDAFMERYPERVEEAKTRLRAVYNERDYPSAEYVKQSFSFEFRYLTFDVPDNLSKKFQSRERKKAMAAVEYEVDEIRTALRTGFKTILDHAVSKLGSRKVDGKDGEEVKPLIFRDTLVSNMEEFFRYFGDKNLVGDGELETLVEKAKKVMEGVTPDNLRDDEGFRSSVKTKLEAVKEEMDLNIIIKPKRIVRFDDDDGVV